MAFKVPEKYRALEHSSPDDGNNGLFYIPAQKNRDTLKIIASDGLGWEHVSVSKKYEVPSWDEMCKVKDIFWGEEDCVVQYHPPKSSYINVHPHVLHLWRPVDQSIPTPPLYMV